MSVENLVSLPEPIFQRTLILLEIKSSLSECWQNASVAFDDLRFFQKEPKKKGCRAMYMKSTNNFSRFHMVKAATMFVPNTLVFRC